MPKTRPETRGAEGSESERAAPLGIILALFGDIAGKLRPWNGRDVL